MSASATPVRSPSMSRRNSCTPIWKRRSLAQRLTMSRVSSKSRAPAITPSRSAARPPRSGSGAENSAVSTASSRAGRCARFSASNGASAMMSATSDNRPGLAWNRENSCTPAGSRTRKSSKHSNAALGRVVEPKMRKSSGTSSVRISRARWLRVARIWPWCQPRTIAATRAGSAKPSRASVARVSGSSSTPVNTRLPGPARLGASSNSSA